MNLLSSFSDFYVNLSSDGMFFFWIVVFLFFFLLFLVVILLLKNKKLAKLLKEEHSTAIGNDVVEDNILKVVNENTIKEEELKDSISQIVEPEEKVIVPSEEPVVEEKEKIKIKESEEQTGPYKKNVLREMNARMQTSPIHIDRKEENRTSDINSAYRREEMMSPLEELEDSYEVNDNMKLASEIVNRMEEEIRPSNIELTDYEKKQEEEAIISYDELLKVKDKIYNITEDEETDEFIDELKSFRLDL